MSTTDSIDRTGVEPSEDEIKIQLTSILEDPEFKRSPKIQMFLEYVVVETLDNKQQYLKAYAIAVAVFQKSDDFDPQTDPIVRVQAVRLRRMLQQFYLSSGRDDKVIIEIQKGSYIPKFYYRNTQNHQKSISPEFIKEGSFPSIAILNFKDLSTHFAHENFVDGISQEIFHQ